MGKLHMKRKYITNKFKKNYRKICLKRNLQSAEIEGVKESHSIYERRKIRVRL